jgi:hypothetical protein
MVAATAVAASSLNPKPHIRVQWPPAAARTLSFALSEKGELQMTQLVDGRQPKVLWESVPHADKACEAGVPLILAMLSPARPYGENSNAVLEITLSLHYNSDTDPVYSVSLPAITGADVHIMRMFRLLCMSSPNMSTLTWKL